MIQRANATQTWLTLLNHLITTGNIVKPRGRLCHEVGALHTVTPMTNPIVTVPYRKLGYRFMFAEAWWILTGRDDVASIKPYSKTISKFSDDGQHFFGAYGPKIREQLDYVVDKLIEDKDTRQAVISIWRENPPITRDVPCTLSIQFLIRDDKLYCIDTMRSSDAWLGWPYDTFNFSMLSAYIILKLKDKYALKLGNIVMNIGSAHLYKDNLADAKHCLLESGGGRPPLFRYLDLEPLVEWSCCWDLIHHLQCIAEQRPLDLRSQWCANVARGQFNR